MPPQRRENLQRKSRRMPMHIRGIRGPTKRHWPANPRRGRRLLNGKVESTNGGRTYRGKASESPRTPAGFVSLRGGICQPNLRCGRRPVNGKVESTNGKKEFTEGKPVNIRVHSRDSRTYAAAFSRKPTARAEAIEWGGNASQRRENLQRKSR